MSFDRNSSYRFTILIKYQIATGATMPSIMLVGIFVPIIWWLLFSYVALSIWAKKNEQKSRERERERVSCLPVMKWLNNRYILCTLHIDCCIWPHKNHGLKQFTHTNADEPSKRHFRFYVMHFTRANSSRHTHKHSLSLSLSHAYKPSIARHGSSIISFTIQWSKNIGCLCAKI